MIPIDQLKSLGLSLLEEEVNGIKIVKLKGDILTTEIPVGEIVQSILTHYGIINLPQNYLIRQVRGTQLEKVLSEGTERDSNSRFREHKLEKDFGVVPSDYTCCHFFNGSIEDYIGSVCQMIVTQQGKNFTVFYRDDSMTNHPEYDIIGEPTGTVFSFRDKQHKTSAIGMVLIYEGKFEVPKEEHLFSHCIKCLLQDCRYSINDS